MHDTPPLPETPFERYIAPADNGSGVVKFILQIVLVVAISLLWLFILIIPLALAHQPDLADVFPPLTFLEGFAEYLQNPLFLVPYYLTLIMGIYPALWLVMKWQKRPFGSLIGPDGLNKAFWKNFFISFMILGIFLAIGVAIAFFAQDRNLRPVQNLELAVWLAFLPLMLVVIFLQTGAEELFFRGYLLQQCAVRWRHPIAWMILPNLIFALLHYDPSVPDKAFVGIVVIFSLLFGVLAADLTRITGSLGAAWGLHFVNNFFGLSILSLKSDDGLDAASLYTTPYPAADMLRVNDGLFGLNLNLLYGFGALIIAWLILRRTLPRA